MPHLFLIEYANIYYKSYTVYIIPGNFCKKGVLSTPLLSFRNNIHHTTHNHCPYTLIWVHLFKSIFHVVHYVHVCQENVIQPGQTCGHPHTVYVCVFSSMQDIRFIIWGSSLNVVCSYKIFTLFIMLPTRKLNKDYHVHMQRTNNNIFHEENNKVL